MKSRRKPTLLVAALLVCAGGLAQAEEPSPPADVSLLVRQLSDPALQVRMAAERQLRAAGPQILTALPSPLTLEPPAADAVRRVRTFLERQQARIALQPGRVTLQGSSTVAAVLQEIARQTGNRLEFDDLRPSVRETSIDVDWQHATFWSAVREVEQQAGIIASADENRSVLRFFESHEDRPPPAATTSNGPFRIAVVSTSEQPDFVSPERRLQRTLFEVTVEPRLRPLFLHVVDAQQKVSEARPVKADDDSTLPQPLRALSPEAQREFPLDRPGPFRISHDAILPQGNLAPPLAQVHIDGRFEIELAAGQEPFTFRHLDEPGPVTRRHGGVGVTLDTVQTTDRAVEVQLTVHYDLDGPGFESHRSWVFHNDVRLTTATGVTHLPVAFETLAEGQGGARLRYRFTDVGPLTPEMCLTCTAPTLFSRVPITFELKDVPANE